jgi:hypothetical protein
MPNPASPPCVRCAGSRGGRTLAIDDALVLLSVHARTRIAPGPDVVWEIPSSRDRCDPDQGQAKITFANLDLRL